MQITMISFDDITPCGGNCKTCEHFKSKACVGCRENNDKCVMMWNENCKIFECCINHDALFCGLCKEFPCEWLKAKLSEWDKDGILKLSELALMYQML